MTPADAATLPHGTPVLCRELRGNQTKWLWTGQYHRSGNGIYRAILEGEQGEKRLLDMRRIRRGGL